MLPIILSALLTLAPTPLEYSAPTYETRTFSWTTETGVQYWDVRVTGVDRAFALTAKATVPMWKWSPTRAGHYEVRVRACNAVGCSDWSAVQWRLSIYPK